MLPGLNCNKKEGEGGEEGEAKPEENEEGDDAGTQQTKRENWTPTFRKWRILEKFERES